MIVTYNNTGEIGVVKDVAPDAIQKNAWSSVQNMVCQDAAIERINGHSENYGTPSIKPYGLFQVTTGTSIYWVYPGLAKAYTVTGSTPVHTDITRVAGDYTGSSSDRWNGVDSFFGTMIINNGVDDPQMWAPSTAATALVDLSNWPASTTAKVIREYKNFLVALNVTESGTNKPHRLMWSQPADPGSLPSSWDYTDATKDAGITDIAGSGILVDCLALGEQNIIYKEGSTSSMQFIGAPQIFRFAPIFTEAGMLAQGCAEEINGHHIVLTQGDLMRHNGVSAESVIDKRMRTWLFKNIDTVNYTKSIVVKSRSRKEVYVLFASSGSNNIDTAVVWDYSTNTLTVKDMPNVLAANSGIIEGASQNTYDTINETYAATSKDYTDTEYTPTMPRLMLATDDTKLLLDDDGNDFDGSQILAFCEKTSLHFGLAQQYKLIKSIRPRFEAATGTQIKIYVGTQALIDSPIDWSDAQVFTVGTDYESYFLKSGRYISIKFETAGGNKWRLNAFDVDIEPQGLY